MRPLYSIGSSPLTSIILVDCVNTTFAPSTASFSTITPSTRIQREPKKKLTSKITVFKRPFHFRDEQVRGAFKFIIHDHYFETKDDVVIMKDVFSFQSPFGFVGRLVDKMVLTNYLKKLLINRNNIIKEFAETDRWKEVLSV